MFNSNTERTEKQRQTHIPPWLILHKIRAIYLSLGLRDAHLLFIWDCSCKCLSWCGFLLHLSRKLLPGDCSTARSVLLDGICGWPPTALFLTGRLNLSLCCYSVWGTDLGKQPAPYSPASHNFSYSAERRRVRKSQWYCFTFVAFFHLCLKKNVNFSAGYEAVWNLALNLDWWVWQSKACDVKLVFARSSKTFWLSVFSWAKQHWERLSVWVGDLPRARLVLWFSGWHLPPGWRRHLSVVQQAAESAVLSETMVCKRHVNQVLDVKWLNTPAFLQLSDLNNSSRHSGLTRM